MSGEMVIVPLLGALIAFFCLAYAIQAGKRRRLIDDTPTCKTTGVFIGLVELKGKAESEQPLESFLANRNCVYFKWTAEEHWSRTVTETYTDSEGKTQTRTRHESGWETVGEGGDLIPFYLQDDCGAVRVVPFGAQIEPVTIFDETCQPSDPLYYAKGPAEAVSNSDHERRFTEMAIPLHQDLYIMGQARERKDIVAAEIANSTTPGVFLISTRQEEVISQGMSSKFGCLGLCGLIAVIAGVLIGFSKQTQYNSEGEQLVLIMAALYCVGWFVGWAWMVFNSIVTLRQRVKQAWSQVDVQLKRRQDLIPNLVATVKGLKDYENKLQTEVAGLRAQMTATPPGEAGADYSGITPMLVAIEERYPELKAEQSFLNLQKNLIDTEQRIALARGYFNEIATFYNTRLQVIPDRFFAMLGGMRPQSLLLAENFERKPVEVDFVQ